MPIPADRMNGDQLLIQVETAPGSNVWEHDCLINAQRGIQWTSQLITSTDPSCDAPTDPAWNATEKDGLGCTITGQGKVHVSSIAFWFNWFKSPDTKNVRVKVNKPGGAVFQGAFHCHEMQMGGDRKQRAEGSVQLTADGEVVLLD